MADLLAAGDIDGEGRQAVLQHPELAGELGADLAMTGVVQKVSNLILNINLYLRDVHTGQLVAAASADMRGNTDESWSRATAYLVRNRLLAPNYGAPQAR